ncbi:MAG: hypothetical protein IT435_03840 [Phycisphaerales bacterium]|nr:hypothetical protein [Phycisphaerales bacterium]
MNPMRFSMVLSACGLAVSCGIAAAQPDLYICEYKFQAAQMSAVRIDGVNPRTLFSMLPAQWLPIGATFNASNGRFYWLDAAGTSKILSANADGSAPATVANLNGFGRGASLDAAGRIFFSVDTTLYRVNANGTGLTSLFTGSVANTMGLPRVDATNGHVYIGTDGKIFRMNLDGSDRKTLFTGGSTVRAIGLDIGAGYLYWADSDTITDFIGRIKLDGTDFKILINNVPGSGSSSGLIEVLADPASGSLFVADDFRNDIRRYPLAGGGFTTPWTSTDDRSPSGMVLSTGEPTQALLDCNGNGVSDTVEIAAGAADCDNNGILDSCQVDPCKPRVLLVDNGSDAAESQGRAIGVPSQWQVFQPFDVPAGGWDVMEIAIDGYMVEFADQSGLRVRLYPDDGTGLRPNESVMLGEASLSFLFNTREVNWVYAPMEVSLPAGRFWARVEAKKPNQVGASMNHGLTGLPSLSRGSSGSFITSAHSVALRIITTPGCPADFDGSGFVDTDDFDAFVHAFELGGDDADFDGSGFVDTDDFDAFVHAFIAGC